jgi:DNA-binding response OmpR family regulator
MRILVVDDDPNLNEIMNFVLREAGHEPCWADTGDEALRLVQEARPDLVLLGLSLPERGGGTMIKQIAVQRDIPVIILAARDDEQDKVLALRLGADDFMIKPVSYRELLARIDAVTRRYARSRAAPRPERLVVGDLEIDASHREVLDGRHRLTLTPTEFELLYYLAINADRIVTREELLRHIWQYDPSESDEVLRVFIAQLRRLLRDPKGKPQRIVNVRGAGYILVTNPNGAPPPALAAAYERGA